MERHSEEKPPTPTKSVKVSGRKKNGMKSENESRNQDHVTKTSEKVRDSLNSFCAHLETVHVLNRLTTSTSKSKK